MARKARLLMITLRTRRWAFPDDERCLVEPFCRESGTEFRFGRGGKALKVGEWRGRKGIGGLSIFAENSTAGLAYPRFAWRERSCEDFERLSSGEQWTVRSCGGVR